jgi:Fibronectin type III domain
MMKRIALLVFALIAAVTIAACGGGGGGSTSNPVVPGQPTNVVATAGNGQVTVTWAAPSGSGTVDSYTVYYSATNPVTTASPTKMTGITANTATITGLTNGTTYYFIVTAIITGVEGTPSAQVTAIPQSLGVLITSPTVSPIASFVQNIASKDTDTSDPYNEIFPGSANIWMLDQDLSLLDGFDLQFNYALSMTVGATQFPVDQTYNELSYYTPLMGAADGVKVAAVSDGASMAGSLALLSSPPTLPLAGIYSAFLNATSDSRLQQTLDLTSVTGTVLVTWKDAFSIEAGTLPGSPGYNPSFSVVARNTDGTSCQVLFTITGESSQASVQSKPLNSTCTGKPIVLSFEEKSMTNAFSQTYVAIDSVSVKDNSGSGSERVANGDFETGDLTGWTTNAPAEVQNITSGARTVEGLTVKRSFYTVPNKLWGRWVDVFENNTAGSISKTVSYETSLGSDGAGIIYYSSGANNKALTSWDTVGGRDIGLVFGNAKSLAFTSDDGSGTVGSGIITVTYDITVPAGGRVALVNFVIMDGTNTGLLGDLSAKATDIDTEAAKIVGNFWTDDQYRVGMTQEQIDAISNLANLL